MKDLKFYCCALLTVLIAGCGSSGNNDGQSATYGFMTPKVNSQRNYTLTTVDNLNNTITQTDQKTVTAVNSDGSYTVSIGGPNGSSQTVGGTTYSIVPESVTLNSSGQEISYTPIQTSSTSVPCSFSPHDPGPTYPLTIGQSWTSNYSVTCGTTAPISYGETGTVAGGEPVTVPAGTFLAIKLQSTLTWTNPTGTTVNESITSWRDVNTDIVVKSMINCQYSGNLLFSSGHPVSTVTVLESQS